ncbi:hypothetical protein SAMN05444287_0643 [Octadecabacter temperatus]|uniref:Uncharacterized protein n=1 Tax=Octadecabacter temperatus TaxID=1458307 RepID=A0A0K0Y3U4_9RHOB|nr:hypothetical protein [Octadecabacter temperatus]AKS45547.1 hypothetical protein OSB_09890 [Octadecabacter temperatus]SIN95394.1 hypothetical protein SAMN05444287_0643 [Octadecabacter temperatus]
MANLRGFFLGATQACFLALTALGANIPTEAQAQQGEQRLSREDARILASRLASEGRPSAAREIALGLLQADPGDISALLILSQAEKQLGNLDAAKTAIRTAWRVGETKRERFAAALTMADLHAAQEAYTRSQIWIRRAIQTAPDQQTEQVAITAFRRVRQENPLAVELSFGLNPSTNVNSGNSNQAISFAYLPGYLSEILWLVPADERPLSGLEISLQTDLRYRIAETATSQTSLEFGLYGRTYLMSDAARASAPEVTGASLSFAQVSLGILHQWHPSGADAPYSASLTYSHDWAGGSPYQYQLNGTLGTQFTLGNDDTLALSASIRYAHRFASDAEVFTYSLLGRWSRDLANDDKVGIIGQMAKATADATDLAYEEATLGVSYDFGALSVNSVSLGLDLSTSYTEKYRVYETSAYDPTGREDRISSLRFDVGLNNVDFYGFQPVVTLQARRTASSVERFDTDGVQIGVNLRSSF